MSVYIIVKRIYKVLVPKALRRGLFWRCMPLPVKQLKRRLIRILEKTAQHDEIYDVAFYNEIRETYMVTSSDAIAESVIRAFSPNSVVDVGCGTGMLLLAFKKRGILCEGLEYSDVAIDICRRRGLKVARFDLEHDELPKWVRSDVVTSTEVAEHLPEDCADHFVDILCNIADIVIITAAEPSKAFGTNHVNEQPKEYWIKKFSIRGYDYDRKLSETWRSELPEKQVAGFYASSLMIFRRTCVG